MPTPGTYCLCIINHETKKIKIGALGEYEFREGYYIYIGSALNSLYPRLERHIKTSSRTHNVTHWHIDYLLREQTVEIESIYIIESPEHLECGIAEKVSQYGEPVPGFGCSDCRCGTHLYNVENFDFLGKNGLRKWV